jgi:uncharacterized protein involved in exopolysaccharide biosynthesis
MDRFEENHRVEENQGTLRDFLYVIFKHKAKILTIFLAIVLTVTIGSFVMDPTYEATSKILVKFGRENVYTTTTQSSGGSGQLVIDTGREERINSEVELLQGRALIGKVIADIGVQNIYPASDPGLLKPVLDTFNQLLGSKRKESPATDGTIILFQKKLEVEAVKKSDIITVSFKHKNPIIAAQVVNRLIDRFIEYHVLVHQQPQSYGFFDEQVKLQFDQLKNSESEFQAYRSKVNIADLKAQRELLLKQISEIEMDLAKTRSEISENEGKLISLKTRPPGSEATAQFGQETEFNIFSTSNPRAKLTQLKSREYELLNKFTETNHQVVAIRQEIAETEQFLATQEKTYHEKALLTINHTLKALRAKEGSFKRDMAKYQQELARINSAEMRLTEMERNLKLNEGNYQLYVKKMEEARVSNAMDKEQMVNISIADPARPPVKPAKPNIPLNIILSIVLGAVSGLGVAFFSEYLAHTFNNPEDVKRHLGLPVLSSMHHGQDRK